MSEAMFYYILIKSSPVFSENVKESRINSTDFTVEKLGLNIVIHTPLFPVFWSKVLDNIFRYPLAKLMVIPPVRLLIFEFIVFSENKLSCFSDSLFGMDIITAFYASLFSNILFEIVSLTE